MKRTERINMRIAPEVKEKGDKLCGLRNRSFSNLVEFLILQEFERFSDVAIGESNEHVIGRGSDDKLEDEYNKFIEKIK
jgi:hypothetical protein